MWELDHEQSWAPKNWWFWNVVLKKTLESPLVCKEIQPANPKGTQPWNASQNCISMTLKLGKIEGRRRGGQQRLRYFDGIVDSMGMSLSKLQDIVKDREAWNVAVQGVTKSWHDWVTEKQQQANKNSEKADQVSIWARVQIKKSFFFHFITVILLTKELFWWLQFQLFVFFPDTQLSLIVKT